MAITVDRALLQRATDHLKNLEDNGPPGQGWQSDELTGIVEDLEALLESSQGEKKGVCTVCGERCDYC